MRYACLGQAEISSSRNVHDPWNNQVQNLTLGGSMGVQKTMKKKKKPQPVPKPVMPVNMDDATEEQMMMQMMGFSSFESTAGKQVPGNNIYAANRKIERKYRQYMNRKGGFNRPLDFMP